MDKNKFVALLVWMTLAVAGANAGDRVGDFALLDHVGKHHQLSYYGDQQAVVIAADSSQASSALENLQRTHQGKNLVFFLLEDAGTSDRDELLQDRGTELPVLLDEAGLVAQSLGLDSVDAVVIDPAAMSLIYAGDSAGLQPTLDKVLAGETLAALNIPGLAQESAVPSYVHDIAPMLEKHCAGCHHEGGIGPWAMTDYNMVRGWSKMMKEVVMTRRMPPGQIDGHVSVPIEEEAGLTVAKQQQLVRWIDAGAPRGEGEDPLPNLIFNNPRYTLGEPDMIVKVPAQTIPATGVLDYRYITVNLNLDKDVWVRAMETIPGDRQVLHHVIAYVSSPADKTVRGRETGAANGDSLGGFAPGRQPDVFRDNSGRLLKAGSSLLLQMHYTTSGKETVDETEIGLFLYDEPPEHVMSGGVAGQRRFLIPPGVKEYPLEGEQLVERDAYLYSLMPHMHYRGKYMSYSAVYPDGREQMLLSVPRYEFNWQFNYQLQEPLFLPAGSKIVARGAMDNSARNPFNPAPERPVHFGLQTKHEMFFGFTTLRYVGDSPYQRVANR